MVRDVNRTFDYVEGIVTSLISFWRSLSDLTLNPREFRTILSSRCSKLGSCRSTVWI